MGGLHFPACRREAGNALTGCPPRCGMLGNVVLSKAPLCLPVGGCVPAALPPHKMGEDEEKGHKTGKKRGLGELRGPDRAISAQTMPLMVINKRCLQGGRR